MAAWKEIRSTAGDLYMVCEDDVKFTNTYRETLDFIEHSEVIAGHLASGRPVLVRMGWALGDDHHLHVKPCLTQEIRMSNPCYALNASMADLLLTSLTKIETTSDIYLHRQIGPLANHYTAFPPLAYELSWSTGQLRSEIRPKQKYIDFLEQQLSEYSPDSEQYKMIRLQIRDEQQRLLEFESGTMGPDSDST
jgi:hypothetical protein